MFGYLETIIQVAVVPGKQFDLRYHSTSDIYNYILASSSDSLEVIIYLPGKETSIHISEGTNKEKCHKLQNKLHELTS